MGTGVQGEISAEYYSEESEDYWINSTGATTVL